MYRKLIAILFSLIAVLMLCAGCSAGADGNKGSAGGSATTEATEPKILSVKEVLETSDLTHVVFEGIVTGYDYGKRHIIIEDVDGSCALQLYKNPGFAKAKVGDLVRVDGYRTYEKGLARITPSTLEIISSGNKSSADEPIIVDASELSAWTNENRTNADIVFKTYTFTNAQIVSISGNYTYIDDQYDEADGRGIKIGIKNDSSYTDISELQLVQGQKYNITGIIYGVSDDFTDESVEGLVLRMSVLSVEDVEWLIENPDEAAVLVKGKRSFLVEDGEDKPDFTTYFKLYDPVDGIVEVTSDMITESVDMTAAGTYPVTLNYTNSNGDVVTDSFDIYVTENGLPVSKALELVPEFVDLHVNGVVVGWGYSDSQKTAMIIEDAETEGAIEIWVNNRSEFQDLNVGDHVVIYSSCLGYEKELPRLSGSVELVKVLETDVALAPATEIEDLAAWTADLAKSKGNFYGRYTFTAQHVKTTKNYVFFLMESDESGNMIQVGLYQSNINYLFMPGVSYKITAVATGVSDSYSDLEDNSITIRFSVMNEEDIEQVVAS